MISFVSAKVIAKRVLLSLLVGSGVGTLLAILIGPSIIEWWATPAIPTVCSCTEQVAWALHRFRTAMAVSAMVSAALAILAVEVRTRAAGGP